VVERKLISLILAAPSKKLPRAFVNPVTGLVKNNVRFVCRAAAKRSFLCAIRLSSDSSDRAFYVRYRVTAAGKDVFTWYGYRRQVPPG
jgi:hypothetical protein